MWLGARGVQGVVATPADGAWTLVDLLAPRLGDADEADLMRELVLTGQGREIIEPALEAMPKSSHPSALAVLEAIGSAASDKQLAKLARRGAFKLRSQRGSAAAMRDV